MNWLKQAVDLIMEEYNSVTGDPFVARVHGVLLEAQIQWLDTQVFAIGQLLKNPQTHIFGNKNIDGWDKLNNNQKISQLFKYFNKSGALAEVRKYMENSSYVADGTTPMHYEIPEVDEPYTGIESKHWEQFKKSKVFDDLTNIFLSHL